MKFWHVLSHVRWAIIAMQQSDRNNEMDTPSLELALTEFLVPRLEKISWKYWEKRMSEQKIIDLIKASQAVIKMSFYRNRAVRNITC